MIIYTNDLVFKQSLDPLFQSHQLAPLWITNFQPKSQIAFLNVQHFQEAQTFRQGFKGLLVLQIQDEANIHAYLSLQPFYIIRSGYKKEDLETLSQLLNQYLDEHYATISIKLGSGDLQLAVSSITYIESFSHYLTLHTKHGEYTIRQNMQKMEMELQNFIRVHKSYLVAIREIATIQATQLILKDQTVIPIGRTYKKELASIQLI